VTAREQREWLEVIGEITAEIAVENAEAGDPVDPREVLDATQDPSVSAALAEIDDVAGPEVGYATREMLAEIRQCVRRYIAPMLR
jgi:hypothetical protein